MEETSMVVCQPNPPFLYTNHSTLPKVNDHFCHTINLYHDNYKYTTNLKIKYIVITMFSDFHSKKTHCKHA